jgi:GGDEF domain-containing protein
MFEINDLFGSTSGDKIIRFIGKVLKKFSREVNAKIYKFE